VAVAAADRRLPAQLRRALQPAHHGGRAGLRGHLPPPGAVGRLVADLRHHRRAGPAGLPAGVPAAAGQGLAYQADAPPSGRSTSTPPWPRPSWRTARSRASPTGCGSHRCGAVEVDTTRPELLAACVALVVHPDDGRHAGLVGTTVRTPLFGAEVPVLAPRLADPDKGTGVAMLCTFGDPTDLIWWRDLGLPMRPVLDADGSIRPLTWGRPGSSPPTRRPPSGPRTSWPGCRWPGPGSGRRPCCARPAPWPPRRPRSPRRSSSTSTAASRWRS
jgi:hypothetical protein